MLSALFRREKVVFLLVLLGVILGGVLVLRLPVQLYPQTQRPRVYVRITHTGYSAVDFSTRFGDDVESRLIGIDGVDILEAEYQSDSSDFSLTFDWQVDSDTAKAEVEAAMNGIDALLPAEIRDNYFVRFFSGENAGFLLMGVRSPSLSPRALYRILKNSVEAELSRIEDAETVEVLNIEDREVKVTLRQESLLAYGLTILEVDSAFRTGILPRPLGSLEDGEQDYGVRLIDGVESLPELEQLIILDRGDTRVRLSDVADISLSYTLPRQALVIEGSQAIRINATPKEGGNVREMSASLRRILNTAVSDGILPEDTRFEFYVDPAEYINISIRNVVRAALIGAGLAMLIVLLSLGELRNTLLIGISLPVTLVLSFILMYAFGISLNLISLGGIALAVGMVIDPSIVVLENIHRHYFETENLPDRPAIRSMLIRSVREVAAPVAASTLTTVLVFLPISFTAPLTNAILGDQASTVIYALVFSLIISLTLIPLLAYRLYRPKTADTLTRRSALTRASEAAFRGMSRGYGRLLRFLIRGRGRAGLTVLISFLLLATGVLLLLPRIPREIISPPSSDRIVIFFRSSELTDRVEIVENLVPEMEAQIRTAAGETVSETFALVSGHFNILFINFTDSKAAAENLGELQKLFVSDNSFYYNVSMWDPAELPLPRTNDLQLSLRGEDPAQIVLLLEELRDLVNDSELYGRVFTDPPTGLANQLELKLRRETVDGFSSLSESQLSSMVSAVLRGTASLEIDDEGETVGVSAAFPDESLEGIERLENFLIYTDEGIVPLKHFFDFSTATDVSGLASEDGEEIFRLYARMPSGSPAADRERFELQIRELVDEKIELPAGYSVVFENPQAEMDSAIRSLFIALAVSVALIYLVLTFQFDSFLLPLVILVSVPLGFLGVVVSLYVFGSSLSLNSLLGTILLSGIVVNNAIIMIDFYLRMVEQYESKHEAIAHAAGLRFPPIVITAMTTILGMLPLAIGLGEGSNIVQPLGIAVSGGLLFSTVFTLFVVPALLTFLPAPQSGEQR